MKKKSRNTFFLIYGGNLTLKYPPNAMAFGFQLEKIKHLPKFYENSFNCFNFIMVQKSAEIQVLLFSLYCVYNWIHKIRKIHLIKSKKNIVKYLNKMQKLGSWQIILNHD